MKFVISTCIPSISCTRNVFLQCRYGQYHFCKCKGYKYGISWFRLIGIFDNAVTFLCFVTLICDTFRVRYNRIVHNLHKSWTYGKRERLPALHFFRQFLLVALQDIQHAWLKLIQLSTQWNGLERQLPPFKTKTSCFCKTQS